MNPTTGGAADMKNPVHSHRVHGMAESAGSQAVLMRARAFRRFSARRSSSLRPPHTP